MMNTPVLDSARFDEILAKLKEDYQRLTGVYPQPSYPETFLLEQVAYQSDLLTKMMSDESLQNLVAFAKGRRLELLGEFLAVPRLAELPSRSVCRFTFNGHSQPVTIASGSKIRAVDNETMFTTVDSKTIQPGEETVDIAVACDVAGNSGNGFVAGEINQIVQPLPFLQSVSNIFVSSGGAEAEGDESYRARLRIAPAKFTTAGSVESYVFHALSAHPEIIAAKAWSPLPNEVNICVLQAGGLAPNAIIQQTVYDVLNDKKVRPLGDRITVIPAAPAQYTIDVTLHFYANSTSLLTSSVATANEKLQTLANKWQSTLGQDIVPEAVIAVCQQLPGVFRATTSLAYTPVQQHEFAQLLNINVQTEITEEFE